MRRGTKVLGVLAEIRDPLLRPDAGRRSARWLRARPSRPSTSARSIARPSNARAGALPRRSAWMRATSATQATPSRLDQSRSPAARPVFSDYARLLVERNLSRKTRDRRSASRWRAAAAIARQLQKRRVKATETLSRVQKCTLPTAAIRRCVGAAQSRFIQPFEIVALVHRACGIGEAAAQLLHDPARALGGARRLRSERPVLSALLALRSASRRIVAWHFARPGPAARHNCPCRCAPCPWPWPSIYLCSP